MVFGFLTFLPLDSFMFPSAGMTAFQLAATSVGEVETPLTRLIQITFDGAEGGPMLPSSGLSLASWSTSSDSESLLLLTAKLSVRGTRTLLVAARGTSGLELCDLDRVPVISRLLLSVGRVVS